MGPRHRRWGCGSSRSGTVSGLVTQCSSRRRAPLFGVKVCEKQPFLCGQPVDMRRQHLRILEAKVIPPDVIHYDVHHRWGRRQRHRCRVSDGGAQQRREHRHSPVTSNNSAAGRRITALQPAALATPSQPPSQPRHSQRRKHRLPCCLPMPFLRFRPRARGGAPMLASSTGSSQA